MGGIAYPMTGQIPVYWRFFAYLGISCLVGEICQTLGMFIGTMLSTDVVSAALLTMASTLPAMLFAGFLVRFSGMPWYFRPLSYFSYLRYAFEAILVIIYGFDRCKPTDGPNFIDELVNSQNPTTLAKNLLEEFNITRRDIFRFSNLLNVDDMCLESVVNGSKAYLGVGDFDYSADSIDYSTDGPFDEIELTPQQLQPSYIMSYYEIKDDAIYFDVYMLFVMLFVLKFAVYLLLQYKTKATK
ncbi:ATP-binding cassette sub-family G member 1 [Halotydeus destructor]|nr:ATP-binding cassette sub-family G member 1 [Halotydeus destructor]